MADYDILDTLDIDGLIAMKKRRELLEKHPYAIWQSKDGKYWYTTLPDSTKPRGVRQIRRHSKKELEESIIEYWEEATDKVTIEVVFTEWNDEKLKLGKIADNTHQRNSQIFRKHCEKIANKDISVMTAEDFATFLEEQIPIFAMTSKSFANLKGVIRGIIKLARKKNLINYNDYDVMCLLDITDRSFKKVVKEDDEEVFDEVEMPKIVSYLTKHLDDVRNAGILLMFVTGVRVGELVALKHGDFEDNLVKVRRTEIRVPNENGGSIYVVRDFPKTQSGLRDIVVPAGYEWLVAKLSRGNPDRYVFINKEGIRLTTNAIRKRLTKICEELNITHKSPHKIRKTYGSILLDNNVDNKMVMSQMGHSDVRCTEKHYHRNRRQNKEKSRILSGIPDFQ